jgi:hypothetical protein
MTKISVDLLRAKFPVQKFTLYGECIVVPGTQFDPDYEAILADQGIKCVNTDVDGVQVTLVRLKKPAGEGEKVVFEPPAGLPGEQGRFVRKGIVTAASVGEFRKEIEQESGLRRVLKGKDTPLGPRWTEVQYKLLMKLWGQHKKVREIAEKFPDRSGHAVACALARLKNRGAIKPRWVCKGSKREIPAEPSTPQPSVHTPVDTPMSPETIAGPGPAEKRQPLVPSISTVVNINVHCDCSNYESVKILLAFLKEVQAKK